MQQRRLRKPTDRQKSYFQLIEKELYNFHATKRDYENQRMAIIEGGGESDVRIQSGPSDSTANKAIKLASSSSLYQMERIINAIEEAYEELDPVRKELIRLKYWDKRYKDYGIIQRLHCGKTTFYEWRNAFIYSIASKLGWDAGQGE